VTFSGLKISKGVVLPPFEPLIEDLLKNHLDLMNIEDLKTFDAVYLFDNQEGTPGLEESLLLRVHPQLHRVSFHDWNRATLPAQPSMSVGLVSFSDTSLLNMMGVATNQLSPKKYVVDSANMPNNHELHSWTNIVEFLRPIDLGLQRIVPGKKVGRTIGIPTCTHRNDRR
jgi:hypothetical protein